MVKDLVKPNLFIVGAPKCGTSSMQSYLGQHPEIFMSDWKEPRFFGSDLDVRAGFGVQDEIMYLSLFRRGIGKKYRGEATVWYLYSESAPREIKSYSPRAKILIMLRNPVDMLFSLHGQFLWSCNEDIEDFEEALAAEPERRLGRRMPPHVHHPAGLSYDNMVSFYTHVKRYFDVFGKDDGAHVIILDDLKADPIGEYETVMRFLDVDPRFRPSFEIKNRAKPIEARFIYRFLIQHPRTRRVLRGMISPSWRQKAIHVLPSIVRRTRRPLNMAPEVRARLQQKYYPEIVRLSELLGRDLTYWCHLK